MIYRVSERKNRQGDKETGRQGGGMGERILKHTELDVYKVAFEAAMRI